MNTHRDRQPDDARPDADQAAERDAAPAVDRLHELLGLAADGALDEALTAELRDLLAASPDARAAYADYLLLHADLAWELDQSRAAQSDAAPPKPLAAAQRGPGVPGTPGESGPPARRIPRPLTALAAALLLAAAAVTVYLATAPAIAPNPKLEARNPEPAPTIATVLDTTGTLFVRNAVVAPGAEITAGDLALDRGRAELMVDGGVNVQLNGRTRLNVHDARRATLLSGSATFDCAPEAVGYAIDLPDGSRVVDLGTRFSVTLGQAGDVRVHVLEGRVRVERPESPEPLHLAAGQVVRYAPGAQAVNRYDLDGATPADAEPEPLLHETFEPDSFDAARWSASLTEPPATQITLTHDDANRFGRGPANRLARLLDTDRALPGQPSHACLLSHAGALAGRSVFTLGFDAMIPQVADEHTQIAVRFVGAAGAFSNGKVYGVTLTPNRIASEGADAAGVPTPAPGRPMHVDFIVNHTDAPLRYEGPHGVYELPARRGDVWLDGRRALVAVHAVTPSEEPGRPIVGIAFFSPGSAASDFLLDNVTVRPGPHVHTGSSFQGDEQTAESRAKPGSRSAAVPTPD